MLKKIPLAGATLVLGNEGVGLGLIDLKPGLYRQPGI